MITLFSCNPASKYEKAEASQISDYLSLNPNLNFVLKPSGLYYLDVTVGTGRTPINKDTVYIKYTGKFLDGTAFDTNVGKADSLTFPVFQGYLIAGFEEAISYMKAGGKAMVIVPSGLAYGTMGYGLISGYTPLLFDIELARVKPGPGK